MSRRLAVVAGSGELPGEVIAAALAAGDSVRAFTLCPVSLPPEVEVVDATVEQPEALFAAIKAYGATHLTMGGAVSLSDADRQRIARALGGTGQGDVALSLLAERLQQITGAQLIGVHQVVPDLLAPKGLIAGPGLTERQLAAAKVAFAAAQQVGAMDLGQAVVVAGERVIAAEDVAGTDDLLLRVARYRDIGLVGDFGDVPLVLGKVAKPQQPMFVDLPAVGPETLAGATAAGIGAIVVEAGKTLMIERDLLLELADELQVSLIGFAKDD
jgi:DUF1009 family protein